MKIKKTILAVVLLLLCSVGAATPAPEEDPLVPAFKPKTAHVPIIMYHMVTKNSKLVGKHGIYPAELEADLKYLKDQGYETVVMEDLIAFVRKGKALPKKPIMLTFDDGNSGDYQYLYPLLQQYDMKAVLSILGSATDHCTTVAEKDAAANPDKPRKYPHATWPQIKEMADSGRVELQNHSYDLHGSKGSGQRQGESEADYHKRLKEDLAKMQKRLKEETRAKATTFTYPLGIISDSSQAVLEDIGLVASLSCHDGMNILTEGDLDCLFRLKRDNRPSGEPVQTVLEKMRGRSG